MGVQERRAREKEELRGLILETARRLFAEEGYEAVSMRRIAEKIEYSPTAIYLHFADKEALFRELCEQDFLALARQFQVLGRIADPVERFRAVGRAYIRFGLDHPNHYRLMFMTPHPPVEHAADVVEKGNPEQDAYAFLRSILDAVKSAGRLRPEFHDLETASQVAWAGVHGIVSLHIAKRNDDWVDWRPVRETADLLVDALTRGMTQEAVS
jgi:AcrR family transcriptional regulator